MSKEQFDFSGYATRNNVRCSDGRIIRKDAFKHCDGLTVPLVWSHQHDEPTDVVGHALLENRDDGVYAYGSLNDTDNGNISKKLIQHGDIKSLSIYANHLKQQGSDVVHGMIREVSLVLSGANPGAYIENVTMAHADGYMETLDEDAIIWMGEELEIPLQHSDEEAEESENSISSEEEDVGDDTIEHADDEKDDSMDGDNKEEKTIGEVFDTLTDEQKEAVYAVIGMALEEEQTGEEEDDEASHSDTGDDMKYNVFDSDGQQGDVLSHDDMVGMIDEAKRTGSLKDVVLAHGITDIEVLFPEARLATNPPALISRNMEWVDSVLGGVNKTPFSRVKSTAANITADEARAKGYIKGRQKVEEQIAALKRVTTPQTIYKLQKLDRDDVVDITDFDVVAWLKVEMRTMLNEEIARAILISDGRPTSSNDKINELNIRPIYTDDEVYSVHATVPAAASDTDEEKAIAFIDTAIRARKDYKGSGAPTLFIGPSLLTECRLIKDQMGHRLYKDDKALADELRVSKIVEVEVMDGVTRTVSGETKALYGIIVNLRDYTVGADKGGEVSLFDDFDLNYNKYEYLIETRISGALTQPKSALVLEGAAASGTTGSTGSTGNTGNTGDTGSTGE